MRSNTWPGGRGDGWDLYRPVWVKLPALFGGQQDESASALDKDALDTTNESQGLLMQWQRTGSGVWLGLVSYEVPYADGRKKALYLERQLLSADALRPRSYGKYD